MSAIVRSSSPVGRESGADPAGPVQEDRHGGDPREIPVVAREPAAGPAGRRTRRRGRAVPGWWPGRRAAGRRTASRPPCRAPRRAGARSCRSPAGRDGRPGGRDRPTRTSPWTTSRPRAAANAWGRAAGSGTGASSSTAVASPRRPTSRATRVLPTPPGPTTVTSRSLASRSVQRSDLGLPADQPGGGPDVHPGAGRRTAGPAGDRPVRAGPGRPTGRGRSPRPIGAGTRARFAAPRVRAPTRPVPASAAGPRVRAAGPRSRTPPRGPGPRPRAPRRSRCRSARRSPRGAAACTPRPRWRSAGHR